MEPKILCGTCRYCHLEVFSEGCGSSLCYVCLHDGCRVIRVDGPSKHYLVAPEWCPGIDVGGQEVIPENLKAYLRDVLVDIRYDHRFEGVYIYRKSKCSSTTDWESLGWLSGFFVVCILAILFLKYLHKSAVWI